ncbi:hypothetical protein KBB27_03145 [Patescibacteria group bacterium]|nr:hypothetical protein [Patescibacteria group bacterium]
MAKATIQSKTGAIITMEGTDEEISNMIAHFETTTHIKEEKGKAVRHVEIRKEKRKRSAASDLIVELKEDGFFDKPRGLTEIAHALEERGRITPVTSLSGVMISLVQQRFLGRKKVAGKWVYGK